MFGRATITLGIGPHSSYVLYLLSRFYVFNFLLLFENIFTSMLADKYARCCA